MNSFFNYWGKAGDKEDGRFHLLPYHCLDVAAVVLVYLEENPKAIKHISEAIGLDLETSKRLIVYLAALHDLGKFSALFQAKRADLQAFLGCQPYKGVSSPIRHDAAGLIAFFELIRGDCLDGVAALTNATMGHHGQPVSRGGARVRNLFTADDQGALKEFERVSRSLFAMPDPLPKLDEAGSKRVSWLVAGLTVLGDWLGSNENYFNYIAQPMTLETYWQNHALGQAKEAIKASHILPVAVNPFVSAEKLFEYLEHPTPLQRAAESVALSDGPQLFILEDATGAGKTEAAYILAHRLMSHGHADGLFVALPTMATANAMYERTKSFYLRLFSEKGDVASLVLAHGNRHLMDGFNETIFDKKPTDGTDDSGDLPSASARCAAWLADNNKKALLAPIGVGTVDQALLAILQSKHQSLRLFGLHGKLLIVDEVHACDAYMNRLLRTLLKAHAANGGSAILLSATLTATQKNDLVGGFMEGLGVEAGAFGRPEYPLITHACKEGACEEPVSARPSTVRSVPLKLECDRDKVVDRLTEVATSGGCGLWIRNTVADAIEGQALIEAKLGEDSGVQVFLFHARFAMGDRLVLEDAIGKFFGKESEPTDRGRKIVIATQVIEQSLDVDFDFMVSDLAPLDSILQRIGRWRRHLRTKSGDRLPADLPQADGREPDRVWIYGPKPTKDADAKWYEALFPKAAYVYGDHAVLWRTASLIETNGCIRVPEDVRSWMEGVYSDDSFCPAAMEGKSAKISGENSSARSIAKFNAINFEIGYEYEREMWSESQTPTRLGEPTIPVRLARWQDDRIVPWCAETSHPWSASELKVRKAVMDQTFLPKDPKQKAAIGELLARWRMESDDVVLVVLDKQLDDRWCGRALKKGREIEVVYSLREGLWYGQIPALAGNGGFHSH